VDITNVVKGKMADACKNLCPACVSARKNQGGLAYKLVVKVEDKCPACRAYTDVYGKLPHEPLD
jgi:hypothetical protein